MAALHAVVSVAGMFCLSTSVTLDKHRMAQLRRSLRSIPTALFQLHQDPDEQHRLGLINICIQCFEYCRHALTFIYNYQFIHAMHVIMTEYLLSNSIIATSPSFISLQQAKFILCCHWRPIMDPFLATPLQLEKFLHTSER